MDAQDRLDQLVPKVTALEHRIEQAQATADEAAEGCEALSRTLGVVKEALTGGLNASSPGLVSQIASMQQQQQTNTVTLTACNAGLNSLRDELRSYREAMPSPKQMDEMGKKATSLNEKVTTILAWVSAAGWIATMLLKK